MSATETIDLELNGTAVRGSLHLPPKARSDGDQTRPGVVLVCLGPQPPSPEVEALGEELRSALAESGLAVATCDGERAEAWLTGSADAASVALHALAARDEIDTQRIGIVGHSLGAISAASAAGRSQLIRRLVLLAPVSRELLAERLAAADTRTVVAELGAAGAADTFFNGLDQLDPARDAARFDGPTLILHGAADRTIPVESSLVYRDAILASGHEVDHLLVGLGDHDFTEPAIRQACVATVARFLGASAAIGDGDA